MLSILPVRIYPRARQIILTTAERHRLEKLAYSRTASYQHVIRARIVLDAARGYANAENPPRNFRRRPLSQSS
jgi:hypothetical protein